MAVKKTFLNVLVRSGQTTTQPARATFGAYRAAQLSERLKSAVTERRKWSALEHSADAPLTGYAQLKGAAVERKIGRLQAEERSDTERTEQG